MSWDDNDKYLDIVLAMGQHDPFLIENMDPVAFFRGCGEDIIFPNPHIYR